MHCSEFLEGYSDYRDGLITDARRLRRLRRHVTMCAACARYDGRVRDGVQAFDEIEPSPGFRARLRSRLAAASRTPPIEPVTLGAAGVAAALMLAAAVALLAYEGSRGSGEVQAAPPRAAAFERSLPLVVVNPGVPFVTFTDLSVSPFQAVRGSTTLHNQSDVPLDIWANLPR
jgi:hypothetical protein